MENYQFAPSVPFELSQWDDIGLPPVLPMDTDNILNLDELGLMGNGSVASSSRGLSQLDSIDNWQLPLSPTENIDLDELYRHTMELSDSLEDLVSSDSVEMAAPEVQNHDQDYANIASAHREPHETALLDPAALVPSLTCDLTQGHNYLNQEQIPDSIYDDDLNKLENNTIPPQTTIVTADNAIVPKNGPQHSYLICFWPDQLPVSLLDQTQNAMLLFVDTRTELVNVERDSRPKYSRLTTHDELNKLESYLARDADDQFRKEVSQRFYTGGKTVTTNVRRALKFLMTDELALTYNWAGRQSKNPFKIFEFIVYTMFDGIQKGFPKLTLRDVEDVVKNWLKNASTRISDLKKKTKQK